MDIKTSIGQFVRKKRKEKKYTMKQLAARAFGKETRDRCIWNLENGTSNISVESLEKILAALDISLAEMFE